MGTSSSSHGPRNKSPLVPPWADMDGQGPGPAVEDNRFKEFRTSLGKFVGTGNQSDLKRALGHYARQATGGGGVGARRLGATVHAGGALFGVLNDLRQGGNAASITGVDLSTLRGQPTEIAIQGIVAALTPPNGDAEKIREAMQAALIDSLQGMDEFDGANISEEMLVDIMVAYLREIVFIQILLDSDRAFQKSANPLEIVMRERDLRDLVDVVVDKQMRPHLASGAGAFTTSKVEKIQKDAIVSVWTEWEAYT